MTERAGRVRAALHALARRRGRRGHRALRQAAPLRHRAAFFAPGVQGASIVVDGWELGLGVCYDGCPEHARAAAEDGARAYLCPSAYVAGSEHRRDLYYAARALDNGIYVVFAGLTGRCGGLDFSGGSAVYDPEGRALGRAGTISPAVVLADLDPAEVTRVQAENPIARDRLGSLGGRSRVVVAGPRPQSRGATRRGGWAVRGRVSMAPSRYFWLISSAEP